jgi:hypothetical protein
MTWDEWLERQNESKRADSRDVIMDSYRTSNSETYSGKREYASGSNKNGKKTQYRLCKNYNEAKCTFEGDHNQGSVIWRHACLGCKLSGHRITECRRSGDN